MFLNPPSLLGLPLGAVIWMGFVALIALGLAIARFVQPIWVARLLVAIVALVACLIVVLGPAIILFILNLGVDAS
jgi:hypothetical protein